MKNILYINTIPSGGGAAAVMQRLDHMMRLRGASTHILTRLPGSGRLDDALTISSRGGLLAWTIWRGQQDYHIQKSHALRKHVFFSRRISCICTTCTAATSTSGPCLFFQPSTVWTLHDMQALTGHCGYSLECERWRPGTGCGHCSSLSSYPPVWRDTTRQLWKDKRTIYAHSSLYLVTPSVWLQRLTEKSLFKEQPLVCIPNGADTSVYRPQDQQEARRLLGLPQGALLVGGCADGGLANPWKGGQYVLETILELKKTFPSLHFLNIGVKSAPEELQNADWVHHIPYVHDPAHLARLYAALDLLLYPSLADSQSLVCVECLCSGTPIVGFATGGVPEVVRDGLDGLLVPTHDGTALIKAAATLLQDADLRKKMGKEAAVSAAQRFNLELFAQRYAKVYEEALRLPRSLEKSRLPLGKVPAIVKSPAFIAQEWAKYPSVSRQEAKMLRRHALQGSLCVTLATIAGWPLQCVRSLRSLYRRIRMR